MTGDRRPSAKHEASAQRRQTISERGGPCFVNPSSSSSSTKRILIVAAISSMNCFLSLKMRVLLLLTFLSLCLASNQWDANKKDVGAGLRSSHRLQADAITVDPVETAITVDPVETEAPTEDEDEEDLGGESSNILGGESSNILNQATSNVTLPPDVEEAEETPATSPVTEDEDLSSETEAPTEGEEEEEEEEETPTPTVAPIDYAEEPTLDDYEEAPTIDYEDEPTYDYEDEPTPTYSSPTEKPATPYIAEDDDPLQPVADFEGGMDWEWKDSSVEELEHDRTALIAVGAVFGICFCFSIITAQQMLDNPDGCCARYVDYIAS